MTPHEERLAVARKDYEERVESLCQHKNLFDVAEKALAEADLDFMMRESCDSTPHIAIWLKEGQSIRSAIVPFLQKLCKERREADLCVRFRRDDSGRIITFHFDEDLTDVYVYTTLAAACQWVQTGTEQVPVYSLVCEEGK